MNRTEKFHTNRNGVKKSMGIAACVLLLCAAGPPVPAGTEHYLCEWKTLSGSDKGRAGESKIEISGDTLKWFVPSPVPFHADGKISYSEFAYKILKRNGVGVVAARPDSLVAPNVGPVVGAQVLSLGKADGTLFVGGVGTAGVSEHLKGHCK